jgi:hypothetical protein
MFWFFLAVPMTYAMISVKMFDVAELGMEFIGADGRKTIVLEPEKWIGKEFPLLSYLHANEIPPIIKGRKDILLYHKSCSQCKNIMSHLIDRNDQSRPEIVFVHLPDGTHAMDKSREKNSSLSVNVICDQKMDWFCETPTLVCLDHGMVTEVISKNEIESYLFD